MIPRSTSSRASYLIFTACAFPIHLWSIIQVLDELPAWILRLEVGELLGVIAYTQAFALLETLLLWGGMMLLKLFLPRRLTSDSFIPLVSALVFIHAFWSGALLYSFGTFRALGLPQLLLLLALYLLTMIGTALLVLRSARIQTGLWSLLNRLTVLISLYVAIDIVSVLVILLRNL